jgi:hypothetical protein
MIRVTTDVGAKELKPFELQNTAVFQDLVDRPDRAGYVTLHGLSHSLSVTSPRLAYCTTSQVLADAALCPGAAGMDTYCNSNQRVGRPSVKHELAFSNIFE